MSTHRTPRTDATGIIEEHIGQMPRRRYWLVMHYGCDRCLHRLKFFLEEGCEGPHDHDGPIPSEMLVKYRERRVGSFGRMPAKIPHTNSGRVVLPVPFVAGRCPMCRDGVLQHVDWSADYRHDTTWVPANAGVFHYPDDWTAYNACGTPVLPSERETHRDEV